MTITPRPHTIHVPDIYSDHFRYIYDGLDDRRVLSPSKDDLPPLSQTRIDSQLFTSAQVARLTIHETGSDFEKIFLTTESEALNKGVEVIQVWLKLSLPWIGKAVSVLKDKGYFFGGILPQWFGEDGLLMQKIFSTPNWQGIQLFSERAQRILEFVKADYRG